MQQKKVVFGSADFFWYGRLKEIHVSSSYSPTSDNATNNTGIEEFK
jgi:hypothetical protein